MAPLFTPQVPAGHIVHNIYIVHLDPDFSLDENLEKHFEFLEKNLTSKDGVTALEILPGYIGTFDKQSINKTRAEIGVVKLAERNFVVQQDTELPDPTEEQGRGLTSRLKNLRRAAQDLNPLQPLPKRPKIWNQGGASDNRTSAADKPFANLMTTLTEEYNLRIISQPENETWSTYKKGYEHWRGSGFVVKSYVFDGGIALNHPEFQGRAVNIRPHSYIDPRWAAQTSKASPEEARNVEDDSGHGTHVAGILGGSVVGVAPNTTIVSVKVCLQGKCYYGGILKALEDVIKLHEWYKRANGSNFSGSVINMSFGNNMPTMGNDWGATIKFLFNVATAAGVAISSAAGNEDTHAEGFLCLLSHFCVGSINRNYQRAPGSNYGSFVDYVAPGESILSARHDSDGYVRKSGTSMAAPHVSGILAIVIGFERIRSNVQKVRTRLAQNAFNKGIQTFGGVHFKEVGNTGVNAERRPVNMPYIGFGEPVEPQAFPSHILQRLERLKKH